MKKLLLMFVALFTMGTMAVYADYQLDLTTANYGLWNDADSYEINADGSVTMTFTGEWHGTGWQNWGNPWDLTQYESVVVEYTDLEGTDGNEEHPWIQLYIGSDPAIGQGDWDQTGRIEFVMADNATDDDGEPIDYSSVGQIMIQPNGALKVTITSVTFVGGNDTDHSGNAYDELPLDNDDDLNAGWNTTYDGATHTITLTGDWGGRGWWLDGDYSAYKGVEVVFTCQNSSYIQLQVEYNEGSGTDGVNANGSEQTLYVEFDQEAAKELKQIYVQGESTGDEIVLVSARLIKESSGDEVTAYFDSSSVDWDPVYCYVFGGSDPWPHITADWPGEVCEYLGDNIWKWTYTGSEEVTDWMIIFCNEAGSEQTHPDFDFYNGGLYNTDGYVGEYTGITSVVSETTSAKVTGIYNLAGQRVNENAKGILIKDGKKVLVK